MTLIALRGNNRADDPNCSGGGGGGNRADDPNCSEGPTFKKPVRAPLAGVQPRLIQGIRRRDGIGDLFT